jgi:hypothetical protein
MLEEMVWDDKIVMADDESISENDGDSDSSCISGSDPNGTGLNGVSNCSPEVVGTSGSGSGSNRSDLDPETIVINQLIFDLKKMKDEATQSVRENAGDDFGTVKDMAQVASATVISSDAVSISESKDAKVQITGRMIHDWITTVPGDEVKEKSSVTEQQVDTQVDNSANVAI